MLKEGKTNEIDYVESIRLFNASAKGGNSYAKVSLGEMYEDGLGVNADRNKAAALYREAIKDGEPAGKRKLAEMLSGIKKSAVVMVTKAVAKVKTIVAKAPVEKK